MLNRQSIHTPLPQGKAGKPLDIIGFITRYGILSLVAGAFVFSLLAPAVLILIRPNYEVQAALKIDPVVPSLMTKSEDPSIINYFHDYARTQARRLKDFELIKETFSRLTPEQQAGLVPAGLSAEKSVRLLEKRITISPVSRTHLLELKLSGGQAEGLAPLLNNLMEVFLEKIRTEAEHKDEERLRYLAEKRAAHAQTIGALQTQLQSLAETIHTSSFSEDFNVLQQKSQHLQKLAVQAFGDRVQAEKEYEQNRQKVAKVKALSLAPMIDELVMRDQSIDFTSSWTYQELQKLRSSIDGITSENPDRIRVEQRMQSMRRYEKKLRLEVRDQAEKILTGKRDYDLDAELLESRKQLQATKDAENEILKSLNNSQQQSSRISKGLIEGETLQQQLSHNRNLLFRIDTRIHELKAEGKAPLRISIEAKARTPLDPTGSNTKKLLVLCLAAAFGSVGCSLLAYDFLDNRIRSPRNIEQAIGHPPTWPISRAPLGVNFHQLLASAPDSQPAKAIRSLAIRLNQEREKNQARVFLFTGVDNGTGCSGITLNCAWALSELAERVLVVEGNQSTSRTAQVPGETRVESALADQLAGLAQFPRGIIRLPESGLDFLPVANGDLDKSSRRRLHTFLRQAREHYDAICIDTGSILQCDLTEYLAVHADLVSLICQGDSTTYRNLRRAAEILVRLGVPTIAPVLNWGGKKKNARIDQLLEKIPALLAPVRKSA